jgi:uncharacterized protein DUF6675
MMRSRFAVGAGLLLLLMLARLAIATGTTAAAAAVAPVPPCAGPPFPAFPGLDAPPAAIVWHQAELPAGWRPPACAGEFAAAPALVVALAARFRDAADADAIFSRFGAVSQMTRLHYWSVTDRAWTALVTRASALTRPQAAAVRGDFTAAEVASGQPLYFLQRDNRSSAPVVYRMVGRALAADRLVIEIENVTPVKFYLLQVFPAGGLRVTYFLERAGNDRWSYYSLTAVDRNASSIALGDARSFINRAVAAYRRIAGIPSDQEPPAAP